MRESIIAVVEYANDWLGDTTTRHVRPRSTMSVLNGNTPAITPGAPADWYSSAVSVDDTSATANNC